GSGGRGGGRRCRSGGRGRGGWSGRRVVRAAAAGSCGCSSRVLGWVVARFGVGGAGIPACPWPTAAGRNACPTIPRHHPQLGKDPSTVSKRRRPPSGSPPSEEARGGGRRAARRQTTGRRPPGC